MKKLLTAISIVLILILSFYLYQKTTEPPPRLLGTYQSETNPPNIIMMSFTHDGEFEEYFNSKLVDSGTFKKEEEGVYSIHSENKTDLLLTQKGDQFYYYFDNDEVYLLKNLDKAPSSILTD